MKVRLQMMVCCGFKLGLFEHCTRDRCGSVKLVDGRNLVGNAGLEMPVSAKRSSLWTLVFSLQEIRLQFSGAW